MRQISFHVKSEWLENCLISTLWDTNYMKYFTHLINVDEFSLEVFQLSKITEHFFAPITMSYKYEEKCTDIESLTLISYFNSTVWKFSNFSATLILRINFGWFHKVKNCHFLEALHFYLWRNLTLENVKSPKN